MASHINRREAIRRLGVTGAGLACGSDWFAGRDAAPPREGLDEFAERVRTCPADGLVPFVAKQIGQGASWRELLGATFLAGARDIRPRPHGILHCVMMVESTFQLAERASTPAEAWQLTMFNVQDFKNAQRRDVREDGDYAMQRIPRADDVSAAAAEREFRAAMDAFDAERAERAVVQWLPHTDLAGFFALFRRYAARCYAFIGHKAIYSAHVEAVLQRIGWQHAEAPIRSLVRASLVDRDTQSFDVASKLSANVPANWLQLSGGDGQALFDELVTAKPEQAADVVLRHLRRGVDVDRTWDAIVRVGSLVFERRPGRRAADGRGSLLPVHALTVPNAMRSSFLRAKDAATKKLLLLQAATWTVQLRDDLTRMVGLSMRAKVGVTSRQEPKSLDDAFARSSPRALRALMQRDEADTAKATRRMHQALVRTGTEHHQHKFAAAMFEEADRVEPSLRATILAAGVDYLANHRDRETDLHRNVHAMLEKAGIR